MTNTMRWQQRFENFEKAYKRFAAAMDRDLDAIVSDRFKKSPGQSHG